jgi:hypothetical protein
VPPDGSVTEIACEILVVGAGLGGTAAALRAARLGRSVCLIEETGWPGGQISTQGVSALDEHQYIEAFGGTAAYYEVREGIRDYYRQHYWLTPAARDDPLFNPGNAWVSSLAFEPRVGAAVLEAIMAGPHDSGVLQVFYHTRAVEAEVYEGRIASVLTRHLENGALLRFRAAFVLDATDLGDLFPLTATAYAAGEESRAETGEPSAPEVADATSVQSFTFPVAVEFCPGETHTIAKPDGYEQNRTSQPYSFVYTPWDPAAPAYRMFEAAPGTYGPFWTYRRALDATNFDDLRIPHDVSILNWSSNDFRGGTVIDRLPGEQAVLYRQARNLSLGFLYWLQTEAPRDDGGTGYPELRPRPDIMGSADGLSQMPYVREGRRLRAQRTILEQDISAASQPGPRAARYDDTVGIGFYPIDVHGKDRTASTDTWPFQIPLGALVPLRTRTLLAAAKNIGTTHLTNGAYRLHPVEWAVGEAAATVADFCLRAGATPQEVAGRPDLIRRLQIHLLDQKVPLYWYDDVPLIHPAFAATQLLAVEGVWEGTDLNLHFAPDDTLTLGDGKRLVASAARSVQKWQGETAAHPEADVLRPEPEDTALPLRWAAVETLVTQSVPEAAVPERAGRLAGEAITRADLAIWLGALIRTAIEGRA